MIFLPTGVFLIENQTIKPKKITPNKRRVITVSIGENKNTLAIQKAII